MVFLGGEVLAAMMGITEMERIYTVFSLGFVGVEIGGFFKLLFQRFYLEKCLFDVKVNEITMVDDY